MNAQKMVLADPSHKLPMPGAARLFSAVGEIVDMHDAFWRNLAADGSIKPAPETKVEPEAAEKPATEASASPAAPSSEEVAIEAAEAAVTSAAGLLEQLRHPHQA